jgi:hypothetical protein
VTRRRLIQILLIVAIAMGVAVDGFFAIVNFYPVAPHASRGPTRYLVMQLDEVQAKWFRDNVLDDFDKEMNLDVQLIRVDDEDQLLPAAAKALDEGKDVVGVTLPPLQLDRAVASKQVRPYSDAIAPDVIARDFEALGDKVLATGKRGGAQVFLPRMTVVDVLVYRVSKVRDAILHWSLLRPQIDAALAKVNGRGLPAHYDLNLSPDEWDAYDIFVMAFYWSHRRYDNQAPQPRVAHRTGDTIDGQIDIAAGLYGAGVNDSTLGTFDSRSARDYFEWEVLFRGQGLYPPAMYGPNPYSDDDVIAALEHGDVFLAPIDAMDAFSLHGGAHAAAISRFDDPADLEFTELPNGASLAIGPDGRAARTSQSFSFRQDWVWALPARAKATKVGYDLVRFLWRPEIHARECEALGMLPTHPDVVASRVSRFRLDWMTHVFEAGLEQTLKGAALPAALVRNGYASIYAQLWTKIVAGSPPISDPDAIAKTLREKIEPHPPIIVAAPPPPPPAAAPDDTAQAIDQPQPLTEDWEAEVSFDNITPAPAKRESGAPR